MKTSIFAKIFGWAQFGLSFVGQVAATGAAPHGVSQWIALAGSAAIAVGTHLASNTDGSK